MNDPQEKGRRMARRIAAIVLAVGALLGIGVAAAAPSMAAPADLGRVHCC